MPENVETRERLLAVLRAVARSRVVPGLTVDGPGLVDAVRAGYVHSDGDGGYTLTAEGKAFLQG